MATRALRSAPRPPALLVALVLSASRQCAAQPGRGAASRQLEHVVHGDANITNSDKGGVVEPSNHTGHGDGDEESAEEGDSDGHAGQGAEGHGAEGHGADGHGGKGHDEGHRADGHGGGGHEEGHGAEGHHEPSEVDIAIMGMLFGGALLVGVAIAILNWNDPDIRVAANQMISVSISIFMAMTMWSEVKRFITTQLIPSPFPRGFGITDPGTEEFVEAVIEFILFVLLWVSISWVCHCTCVEDLRVWHSAMKTLVPHLVGLIGAEFTMSVQIWAFEKSHGSHIHCFLVLVFIYLAIQLCKVGTRAVRSASQFRHSLGTTWEKFEEAAAEGEDDASAFISSGGILVWTVCWLHQQHACNQVKSPEHLLEECQEHEDMVSIEKWLGIALVIFAILLGILLVSLQQDGCRHSHTHVELPESLSMRAVSSLKILLGFTIGRILLLATRRCWQEMTPQQHTLTELSTALSTSLLAVLFTFIIDKAADTALESDLEAGQTVGHAARSFMGVFGLVVGLSWEEVFMAGNHTLVHSIGELLKNKGGFEHDHKVLLQTLLTVVVIALVLPNWAKYMIPRAEKSRQDHADDIKMEEEGNVDKKMFDRIILRKLICRCCWCCPCSSNVPHDDADAQQLLPAE